MSASASRLRWDGLDVAALLSLEPAGPDRHLARLNQLNAFGQLFGGQALGQALMAAAASARGRAPHSMHGYFLRPGSGDLPMGYGVERTRDGRSFSSRCVTGTQGANAIVRMQCCFHAAEAGWEHAARMPDVPPPEALDGLEAQAAGLEPWRTGWLRRRLSRAQEVRPVSLERMLRPDADGAGLLWLRVPSAANRSDPALQAAVLAWASDFWISSAVVIRHARAPDDLRRPVASIDHAMWFHRPVDCGDWLLLQADSPSACGGTGLSRGTLFDRSGRVVASVAQDSLHRAP